MISEEREVRPADQTDTESDVSLYPEEKNGNKRVRAKVSASLRKITDVRGNAAWFRNKTLSLKEAAIIRKYWPYIEAAISKIAGSAAFEIIADELIIAKIANIVIDHLPLHMRLILRKTGMDRILVAALSKVKKQIIQKIAVLRTEKLTRDGKPTVKEHVDGDKEKNEQ
ncbi:hypothetical protein [Acetobacter sicerae]|uniref:hypothetical protein n=1 Tax=Acetobacter sicerae TaxID=85325 RepID=UPI00156BB487|nr:hypothetical protein [Acetobacter sicerae]NHN90632.1 hypothetical protein [Acetobacter sicerae]